MKTWIIEPRDPLIVRDGRPFGPIPGARAASLSFPFPSTTTGGVRTQYGLGLGEDFEDEQKKSSLIAKVKRIAVTGPLLVEVDDETGDVARWFAWAPADALLLDVQTRQIEPKPRSDNTSRVHYPPVPVPICQTVCFLCA